MIKKLIILRPIVRFWQTEYKLKQNKRNKSIWQKRRKNLKMLKNDYKKLRQQRSLQQSQPKTKKLTMMFK